MTTEFGDATAAPLIFDDGSSTSEFDSAPEVEAAFRTQRRIAVGYATLFAILTLAVPALSFVVPWWTDGRIIGGMSPAFLMAAVGLYVVFFVLAIAASTLSSSVEEHMLGARPAAALHPVPGEDGIRRGLDDPLGAATVADAGEPGGTATAVAGGGAPDRGGPEVAAVAGLAAFDRPDPAVTPTASGSR